MSNVFSQACRSSGQIRCLSGMGHGELLPRPRPVFNLGRALLFPSSATADVDLDMGEFEWEQIVANLTSGQNLQQAVANANTATANKQWFNLQGQQVPAQAWQVIGDSGNGGTGIHF
jgi:hypothetical protein